MVSLLVPAEGYSPKYGVLDTQRGIKLVKDTFQRYLADALNLPADFSSAFRVSVHRPQ